LPVLKQKKGKNKGRKEGRDEGREETLMILHVDQNILKLTDVANRICCQGLREKKKCRNVAHRA
jgi:predicted transposase YdaD